MMHKLLPQEITPFRVDFEGVAGLRVDELKTDLLSFNPNDVWFYRLPDKKKLGTFTLAAKSVVTEYDLNRTVGIQNLTVKDDEGRLLLQGELINNGTGKATIPHILVTLYDKDGEVVLVDHAYLREAIRPHRTKNFEIRLTPLDQLFLQLTPGYWPHADSETSARLKEEKMKSELIELPPGYGYRYLRVSDNYFSGSVQ
jgi:hypothetical protein